MGLIIGERELAGGKRHNRGGAQFAREIPKACGWKARITVLCTIRGEYLIANW